MKLQLWLISLFSVYIHYPKFGHGFSVFWNSPTQQCQKYGIYFNLSSYNINQNTDDAFYGDKVSLFYDPGQFPHFKGNVSVLGGIPQAGDLLGHVEAFRKTVQRQLSDNFTGFAILDFEWYQPIYELSNSIYHVASSEWIRERAPDWPPDEVENFAKITFNDFSKEYMQILLKEGSVLRPGARWGYYHYPYCSNPTPSNPVCGIKQRKGNRSLQWLFRDSGALYPSIYIYKKGWNSFQRQKQVLARLVECDSLRLLFNATSTPVLPYFWYKYHDETDMYLSALDVFNTINTAKQLGLYGVIIWGGGHDDDSAEKCLQFKHYIKEVLGPVVRFLTNQSKRSNENEDSSTARKYISKLWRKLQRDQNQLRILRNNYLIAELFI